MHTYVILLALVGAAMADAPFFQPPHRGFQPPPPTGFARFQHPAPVRVFQQAAPAPFFNAPAPAPFFNAPAPAPFFNAPAPAPVFRHPAVRHPDITVVRRTEQLDESGQFSSSFETSDGSTFHEIGKLKPTLDGKDHVVVKEGSFKYTSPEGIPVEISYVADEFGFRPTGNVLPVAPVAPPPTF